MKKLLVCVLVLVTSQAFATKARVKALGNSFHLTDTQTEFVSPYHLFSVKDFASIESGKITATGVDDGAEFLVKFSINDTSKLLVAVGHKDEAIQAQRKFLNLVAGTAFVTQQNPVELVYAAKTDSAIWGLGFFYSNFRDKVAGNSESSAGFRVGAAYGDFKWKANFGLVNKVESATDGTLIAQPYANVALRYNMGINRFGFDFTNWDAKRSNIAGTETDSHTFQNIKLQYLQTLAKDGEDFFYGIAIDSVQVKNKLADKKLARLALPVWFGFETQASDWLTLRASMKQTLLAQSKDENGYAVGAADGAFATVDSDFEAEPNNTELATGVGLKYNQVSVDGTLKALIGKTQTQQINSANLLAAVGVTYQF